MTRWSGVSRIALVAGLAATVHYSAIPYARREEGRGPSEPDSPPLAALIIGSTGDSGAGYVVVDSITDAEYSVAPAIDWERKLIKP